MPTSSDSDAAGISPAPERGRMDAQVVQSLPVAISNDGREWRWHFDGILPGTPALPLVAVIWRRGANPHAR